MYMTLRAYITDPNVEIDLTKGLPKLRENWINERGDTEQLSGDLSSSYGQARARDITTANLRYRSHRQTAPRQKCRWKSWQRHTNVLTHVAVLLLQKMEYIAIRETQKQHELD